MSFSNEEKTTIQKIIDLSDTVSLENVEQFISDNVHTFLKGGELNNLLFLEFENSVIMII